MVREREGAGLETWKLQAGRGIIIVSLPVLGTAAACTHVVEESSATGPRQAYLLLRTSPPNGIIEASDTCGNDYF